MPFDLDVYRDILLRIDDPKGDLPNRCPVETLAFYVGLMRGLVVGEFRKAAAGNVRSFARLTDEGSRFAEYFRDEARWPGVKRAMHAQDLPLSVEAVRGLFGTTTDPERRGWP